MFGYFQSAAEEHEEAAGVGEEVSIFTVSKRRRVGEAAGMPGQLFFLWSTFYNYILEKLVFKLLIYSVLQRNDLFALMGYLSIFILYNVRFPITGDKTRRDTVQCLRFVPSLDGYVSASQKGAIVIWNSSVSIPDGVVPDVVLFLVT